MCVRVPPADWQGIGHNRVVQFDGVQARVRKRDPGPVLVALIPISVADAAGHCLAKGAGDRQPFALRARLKGKLEFDFGDVEGLEQGAGDEFWQQCPGYSARVIARGSQLLRKRRSAVGVTARSSERGCSQSTAWASSALICRAACR
jgi:hypothetical protein